MSGDLSGLLGDGSGGISPEQMALSQFTLGQNLVGNASAFGNKGMGMSTGLTQADAGAYMGEALQTQQISQADTQAINAFNSQNKASLGSSVGGLGSLLGSGGGSGGTGGSVF